MTTTTQELETQLLEYINKKDSNVSFEQKKSDDLDFDMSMGSIKGAFTKPLITMGIGAASSGLLAGAVASAIPVNLQFFAGMPTILTGVLGRVLLGTKGATIKNFFDGVLIAGISQTVSRFIPATLPFGQEGKQNFSQEMKNQFKQETQPCNDIKTMRTDVTW
jgi:hypothetical protein